MELERSVLHINVADFGVAVERLEDRGLVGVPVIIASSGAARGSVYDMSEEAYHCGVRKGMKLRRAVRWCREARVVVPRFPVYRRAMQALLAHVRRYSPLVEHGAADGHLFVDVTGTHRLFGPPPDIGWRLRKGIRRDLGVDPIWSVGSSKLVAKVASRLVKPVGEYIVGAGEESAFLDPLEIGLLPGLSWREKKILRELNIRRIGGLRQLGRQQLMVIFGARGPVVYRMCRGMDQERVGPVKSTDESIRFEGRFVTDTNDRWLVRSLIGELVGRAARELRGRGCVSRRLVVELEYSDGGGLVRQATRKRGSSQDDILLELALLALKRAWKRRTRLRVCTLICDRLQAASPQRALFSMESPAVERRKKTLVAMDVIRDRFGHGAVCLGGGGEGDRWLCH